jgi:hypothetical protein
MSIYSQVRNGGWGAAILYVYSLFILIYWKIASERIALVVAAAPALLVMFVVVTCNHRLNDFWAGGYLKQSTEEIAQIVNNHDFYHSASKEIQDTVDDFDKKAYSHHVAILSGVVVAVSAPIVAYFAFDLVAVLGGLLVSIIAFWALSVRSYREINRLAEDLSTPYVENYENQ